MIRGLFRITCNIQMSLFQYGFASDNSEQDHDYRDDKQNVNESANSV